MTLLHPSTYLKNQTMAESFVGPILDTRMLDNLSFTCWWSAFAATDGDIYLETTDDPRAEQDKIRGTSTAKWTKRTLPAGSYDGSNIALAADSKGIDIDANAGDVSLNFVDLQSFARLGYTRRGGGTTDQFQATVSGS